MTLVRDVPGCWGCPLKGDGSQTFVPDEIRERTSVFVMGQNPGYQEEKEGRPFVGPTGQMQDRDFLPRAGLTREDVSLGNAIRCRWRNTNDLPPLHTVEARKAIEHCMVNHTRLPEGTRLIVAEGQYALWALTGEGLEKGRSAMAWRGFVLPLNPAPSGTMSHNEVWTPGPRDIPVLVTGHLALLFKEGKQVQTGKEKRAAPALKVPFMRDWAKVRLILQGKWPQPMPPIMDTPPAILSGVWAFDTEYDPESPSFMLRYSLAHLSQDGYLSVAVVERHNRTPLVLAPGGNHKIVMHNAPADLDHLIAEVAGGLDAIEEIEDTSYMHSVLWSDLDHDLNFLGSYYARINRWKHLILTNPTQYSAGDAIATLDAYYGLYRELLSDPDSFKVYRGYVLPQVWTIWKAQKEGLRVDKEKVSEFLSQLEAKTEQATLWAQATAGWPINLNSYQQVSHHIYRIEQVKKRVPLPKPPMRQRLRVSGK